MWSIARSTGRPLHPDLVNMQEWPHTITTITALRQRYDSYAEFSEPLPQEHWDYPHLVRAHIDRMYPSSKKRTTHDVQLSMVEE
jgi:hypothetical protein